MAAVLGVGGLFFRCQDVDATVAWYVRVLGLKKNDYGGFDFPHRSSAEMFPEGARTIFSRSKPTATISRPLANHLCSTLSSNFIVDDLDGVLAMAKNEGVEPVQPPETYDYGRFAWLMDPEGRKVELWEPAEPG